MLLFIWKMTEMLRLQFVPSIVLNLVGRGAGFVLNGQSMSVALEDLLVQEDQLMGGHQRPYLLLILIHTIPEQGTWSGTLSHMVR